MKTSRRTRAFVFFLMAQFLNVQVQVAFGTEAVTSADPALSQALRQMEERVQARIADLSENATLHYAYHLYKLDVRLRNKTFRKTNEEIQERISNLNEEKLERLTESTSDSEAQEDLALGRELRAETGLQDLAAANTVKISFHRSQLGREQLLKNTDPLLLDLGSSKNGDGSFAKADFQTFKAKVFELGQAKDVRAPASIRMIVKIILSLLIVASGLAILFFLFLVVALATIWGGAMTSGGIVLIGMLASATILGMVFGMKAVLHSARMRSPFFDSLGVA